MKNFLFHDDKSTHKDELFLSVFIVACLAIGILLYALVPSDLLVLRMFGLIFVITGVMFIPGLLHRLFGGKKANSQRDKAD